MRFFDSADSLVSALVGPAVADSLRSDRIWLNLSPYVALQDDSPARRDSLVRARSLMDERVRLKVGSTVADSMATALDTLMKAVRSDDPTFEGSRWNALLDWRRALQDSLRSRARWAALIAVTEADSVLVRRILVPVGERLDSLASSCTGTTRCSVSGNRQTRWPSWRSLTWNGTPANSAATQRACLCRRQGLFFLLRLYWSCPAFTDG